jgi:hypothetical protein
MSYIKRKDNQAGYLLLWLIKNVAGCDYEIPKITSFNATTVSEALSNRFSYDRIRKPEIFVEILCHLSCEVNHYCLHIYFIGSEDRCHFNKFVCDILTKITMAEWPGKYRTIGYLLRNSDFLCKNTSDIPKALIASDDPRTKRVGCRLGDAQCEGIASVDNFANARDIPLNDFPFSLTCNEFVKKLNSNVISRVFVNDSIMMGFYRTKYKNQQYLLD